MLKGALALALRQILLIVGGGLATAGVVASTGNGHFCVDTAHVANASATALVLLIGGGASTVTSLGWRVWAKNRNGTT